MYSSISFTFSFAYENIRKTYVKSLTCTFINFCTFKSSKATLQRSLNGIKKPPAGLWRLIEFVIN